MTSPPSGVRTYLRMHIRAPALPNVDACFVGWILDIIPDPKDDIVTFKGIPIDYITLTDRLNKTVASLQGFGADRTWQKDMHKTDWYEFKAEAMLKMTVDETTAVFGFGGVDMDAVPFMMTQLADCTDGKGPGPRTETLCLICKESFQMDTETITHAVCRHTYCRECLCQWVRDQRRTGLRPTCPMDRRYLVESTVPTHLGRNFIIRRTALRLSNGEPDFETAFRSWLPKTQLDVLLDPRRMNIMRRTYL